MRCCKTLPRCPAQRPLQLSNEDSLGKLHDICFWVVPSYNAGEALRPPPRPFPLFNFERRNSFGYSFLDLVFGWQWSLAFGGFGFVRVFVYRII